MAGPGRAAIVVLAGGFGTRMGGGDKALAPLGEATLLDHVLARLAGQAEFVLLSANGDPARFARFGLPVVPDTLPYRPGPLAGILAAMAWLAAQWPGVQDVASVPADCPFVPFDLVARLLAGREAAGAELACATSLGRTHPAVALWPLRLALALRAALADEGLRRVGEFASRYRLAKVDFAPHGIDPFFNANTREDLALANTHLRSHAR